MRGHVAKKGNNYYAVIYDGINPPTGKDRHRWYGAGPRRIDAERLASDLVARRARSLSSTVDQAVGSYLSRLRHLRAVDGWLAELEAEHGPVNPQTLEWAARIVDDWAATGESAAKVG